MSSKDALASRIGKNLKALRQGLGLNQKTLAAASGLSSTLISRIESGLVMPSIATLQEIADSLRSDIAYFFKGEGARDYVITRKGTRKVSYGKRGPKGKVTYGLELLAEGMENPFMEPCIVTEYAKAGEEFQLAKHNGQEFIYVLEGKLELTLGEEKFMLNEGDAAYFLGEIPHGGKSLGKRTARTLNVHLIPGSRIGTFEPRA